ncbi:MAG: ASKHA domain-containing protein [Candidatus Latescibacterota bacterium]|nr:ASKHA domain-containing protein [Candidatus Latescibacterota bacterium]
MQRIDPAEYQKRLARLSSILKDIAGHANDQATFRCPYKNRFDQCTAHFGCRNQRKPQEQGGLLICGGDDKLDYRFAWEEDQRPIPRDASSGNGRVRCDGVSHPLTTDYTLFDFADELGTRVPTSCGRTGRCHECIVEIKSGAEALNAPTPAEDFLRDEFRLACLAMIENADIDIEFAPLVRTPKILIQTAERPIEINPVVQRRGQAVYYGDEEVDEYRGHLYGLAIDLGTTTIVLELIDLETGESVHLSSFENPQRFGGSDIMHRISYDGQHPHELRRTLVKALNHEIHSLCQHHSFARQAIYEIVVAGNSTMRDILFHLDVQGIGQKPYKSLIENEYLDGLRETTSLVEKTRRIGLRANPKARVYSLPLIASHVGADVAADLVAIDMDLDSESAMLVDVGTNTEVVVAHEGRLVVASCPAGPAFEGGGITYGMPGYRGAIESIRWGGDAWQWSTIGDTAPEGLCGSGLIELLAELRRHDLMTPKGVFADRRRQFDLVPERGITFSRLDASNLAQAKAANFCGQYIVLRTLGLHPDQVQKLHLAGGFANYVDVDAAIDIGFLAPVPRERIAKVGNAAAQGAREVLLSQSKRARIEALVKRIDHIELETTPDFFELFVEGCQFKPMPSVL